MNETTKAEVVSTETTRQEAVQQDQGGEWLYVAWIAFLVTLLVTSASLAAYHFLLAKPAAGFAVVDIASVVKVKEAEFTSMLSRPNVNDQDRQAAFQLVSRIGPEIERAVGVLQKECGCTIVVKSAVIAGPAEDLTPRLKELLGMSPGGEAADNGVKP